jgi:hypothetical protein
MKLLDYIFLIIICAGIIYYIFVPNIVIDERIEYLKGDTITTVINQTKFDSLEYHFKAEIEKIKKSKIVYRIGKTDTLIDTVYLYYSSKFNLGDSVLGTSGIVAFDFEEFIFDSISYRYPEKLKRTVDTLKIIQTVVEPADAFYLNHWFYTTIALFLLIINSF